MYQIKQPQKIILGPNSSKNFQFLDNSLIITSSGTKQRGWLDHLGIQNYILFDKVEPNPSFDIALKIIDKFSNENISSVIGLGGGSSLDVAKYVAWKLKKEKIMIPTTFGSGSEVTRISVLKVNGKKQSFHDDALFADLSIIDSYFIQNSPPEIIRNSAIDAVAQCTEGYDSKNGNVYTKFLCENAFDLLENGILNMNKEKIVLGSVISGLGFGNCSTTLGHALSYVFSNEGFSHGHALAYTTLIAHKYNNSKFYERFKKLVENLEFPKISLSGNLEECAELILTDKKHLDNNPKSISKEKITELLEIINNN
jgi:malonic semialdehyde reductase